MRLHYLGEKDIGSFIDEDTNMPFIFLFVLYLVVMFAVAHYIPGIHKAAKREIARGTNKFAVYGFVVTVYGALAVMFMPLLVVIPMGWIVKRAAR